MPKYALRKMLITELDAVYDKITSDFVPGEYPPKDVLSMQFQKGAHEGFFLVTENQEERAYVICSPDRQKGYVLLSLMAVDEAYRGQGLGKRLVTELISVYQEMNGLIAEVEIPDHGETDGELQIRRKRIAFYESLGFEIIPGLTYVIWDLPMHLMARPLAASRETLHEGICGIMEGIYLNLMGKRYMHKLVCTRGGGQI